MTTVDSKLICDFCGKQCETVQRIALDKDYDRITVKHQIKYACQECSEKKEKDRRKQWCDNGSVGFGGRNLTDFECLNKK